MRAQPFRRSSTVRGSPAKAWVTCSDASFGSTLTAAISTMHVDVDAEGACGRMSGELIMSRTRWIAGACLAVTVFAVPAAADVGVELITTSARPGQLARLHVFAPARMPLYLVTASRAPHPYHCRKNAICEPRSIEPPRRWPYVRLRVLSRTRAGSSVSVCRPFYQGVTAPCCTASLASADPQAA